MLFDASNFHHIYFPSYFQTLRHQRAEAVAKALLEASLKEQGKMKLEPHELPVKTPEPDSTTTDDEEEDEVCNIPSSQQLDFI